MPVPKAIAVLALAAVSRAIALPPIHFLIPDILGRPTQTPLVSPHVVHVQRYNVTNRDDVHRLMKLAKTVDADVWSITHDYIDMVLPPDTPSELEALNHISFDHIIPSPALIMASSSDHVPSSWALEDLRYSTFHAEYHNLSQIMEFGDQLANTFPHQVELVRLGQTSEDREILAIRVGKKATSKKSKPRIVILGAQHARDWIATSSALYIAHALVVPPDQGFSMNSLLDAYDFTIIPVSNPDGYVYTWEEDRLWYKNRSPVESDNRCVGIDMNRNWGYQWEGSTDPCHHWYAGSRPFEAPEVNAIASYIERTSNIEAVLDLRSYGQMIMYPFSYACDIVPADAENLIEVALGASKASKHVHGTNFITGSACDLLYSSPGSIIDWAYATSDITFTYSISLRDTGTYGFLLPAKWIRPVGEETAALVEYLARWILKHPSKKKALNGVDGEGY